MNTTQLIQTILANWIVKLGQIHSVADGKCSKSDCSWDHTDKGMRHCLKQTFARCQSSKFFPGVDEYIKMCREPAISARPKPVMGAPKRS